MNPPWWMDGNHFSAPVRITAQTYNGPTLEVTLWSSSDEPAANEQAESGRDHEHITQTGQPGFQTR